jgi:predicted alpha/beta superfamily hydrolase
LETTINLHCDAGFGNSIFVRGEGPLQWNQGSAARVQSPNQWTFGLDLERPVQFKPILNDQEWSIGGNYQVSPGQTLDIHPVFGLSQSRVWVLPDQVQFWDADLPIEVYLPPSYFENPTKNYPVLYGLDGQNLFDSGTSFNGVPWNLDSTATSLIEAGVIEELIIVGIHNRGADRSFDYTPYPDPDYGGGGIQYFAEFLVHNLKPFIDSHFRTLPERENTGIIGSSLGGLCAFYLGRTYASWFSKVACMSVSFWWDNGKMISQVRQDTQPSDIKLYLDCGTAAGPEEHANLQMLRVAQELRSEGFVDGQSLEVEEGYGEDHNEASWADRVHLPLEFLFPWVQR